MIVKFIAGGGNVGRGFIIGRNLDGINEALGQTSRRYILPVGTGIFGKVYQAIIATGIDHAFFVRRFDDITKRSIIFCTHGLVGKRHTGPALFFFFITGKVRGSFCPCFAQICCTQQIL